MNFVVELQKVENQIKKPVQSTTSLEASLLRDKGSLGLSGQVGCMGGSLRSLILTMKKFEITLIWKKWLFFRPKKNIENNF